MDTRHILKTLSRFGLTENEAAVYLEAVRHSQISPFKLARLTGIPRTTVYDVMMSLALKGLITVKTSQGLEKQQSWIVANNPSALRDILTKRRKELMELEVDVVDMLSDLKAGYLSHETNGLVKFFPGVSGVRKAYGLLKDMPDDAEILFFDHMMPMDTLGKEYVNEEVSQSLKPRTVKKRVKTIMPLNDWTRHVLTYQYGRNPSYIDYHEYRYIEDKTFILDHDMYIVSDKVILICAKDDEVWAAVISSRLVAASLRSLFHVLWRTAIPVTNGFVKDLGDNEFLRVEKKRHH